MKFELSHDRLANQVFDKTSVESKARRKVKALVERAHERFQLRGVLLTQDDIDEIKPFEKAIQFSPSEIQFIQKSKAALQAAAQRRQRIALTITSVLALLLVLALWQWRKAVLSGKQQIRMRLALQADDAIEEGRPSTAFRLIEAATTLPTAANSQEVMDEVLNQIWDAGLQRDLIHPDTVTDFDIAIHDSLIITGCKDGTIRLWKKDGSLQEVFQHKAAINAVRFSKDGLSWASASADASVAFYESKNDSILILDHPSAVIDLAFGVFQRKSYLLTACEDGSIQLFDQSGKAIFQTKKEAPIVGFGFNGSGDHILMATPSEIEVMPTLKAVVPKIPLQSYFYKQDILSAHSIVSDNSRTSILVQAKDSSFVLSLQVKEFGIDRDSINGFAHLNDHLKGFGNSVVSAEFGKIVGRYPAVLMIRQDSTCKSWSARRKDRNGQPLQEMDFTITLRKPINYACFSPSGKFCFTSSQTNESEIWRVVRKELKDKKEQEQNIKIADILPVRTQKAQFSNNDEYLITSYHEPTIRIWNWHQAKETVDQETKMQYFKQHLRELTIEEKAHFHIN
jgi:WD40 repeat protein